MVRAVRAFRCVASDRDTRDPRGPRPHHSGGIPDPEGISGISIEPLVGSRSGPLASGASSPGSRAAKRFHISRPARTGPPPSKFRATTGVRHPRPLEGYIGCRIPFHSHDREWTGPGSARFRRASTKPRGPNWVSHIAQRHRLLQPTPTALLAITPRLSIRRGDKRPDPGTGRRPETPARRAHPHAPRGKPGSLPKPRVLPNLAASMLREAVPPRPRAMRRPNRMAAAAATFIGE